MTDAERLLADDIPGDYPDCAEHASIIDSWYNDFDLQSERLVGCDQTYFQLSSGQYKGRFLSVELGPTIDFHFEFANQRLQQFIGFPDDLFTIGLVFSSGEPFLVNGMQLSQSDLMICRPGGEMNMVSPAGGAVMAICIRIAGLSTVEDWGLWSILDGSQGSVSVYEQPQLAQRLRSDALAAINALRSVDRSVGDVDQARIEAAAIGCILGQLELFIAQNTELSAKPPVGGYDVLRRFHGALLAEDDPLSSYDRLTARTGMSRRTVQSAFANVLEMTPIHYSRAIRLNLAKRRLLARSRHSKTIGDVAEECGFSSWSRFTQYYAELFGERPSETQASGYRRLT